MAVVQKPHNPASCWVFVEATKDRPPIPCDNRARKHHLTCAVHNALEAKAQALKEADMIWRMAHGYPV